MSKKLGIISLILSIICFSQGLSININTSITTSPKQTFRRVREVNPIEEIAGILKTIFSNPNRAEPGSRAISALQYGSSQGFKFL